MSRSADRAEPANRVRRLVRVRRDDDDRAVASSTNAAFVEKPRPRDRDVERPGEVTGRERGDGGTSSTCAPSGGAGSSGGSGCGADERPAVELDDRAPCSAGEAPTIAGRLRDEERHVVVRERGVEAPLEADRRRGLRAHRLAAQRPGDVARVHLDAVPELDEPPQRVEQPLGALASVDREVGPRGVADEQRVAGEDDPRLGSARAVAHGEAAVLRPVPRRVDAAQDDLAERDLVAVLQRVVRVLGLRRAGWTLTGRRARARAGRARETWSACVCVSTTARCERRAARPPRGTARSRRPGRRRRRCRFSDRRRGRTHTRARRRRTA